jgi:hypothetical protein
VYGSNTDFLNKLLAVFFFLLWRFISQKLYFYFSSLGFLINQVLLYCQSIEKKQESWYVYVHIYEEVHMCVKEFREGMRSCLRIWRTHDCCFMYTDGIYSHTYL